MVNILLSLYNFDEDWCFDTFKELIKPKHKVLIVPFSYHEDWLKNENDWNNAFNPKTGTHYREIISPFLSYKIPEDNITWVNQFIDDKNCAKDKVKNSDIIFFTGGYPDKMMKRLKEFDLIDVLEDYKGIMIGSSAGAMIQIKEYHITKDNYYEGFSYNKGLNIIKDFDIEVHYENSDIQNMSISKCLNEKQKRFIL
ncbi:Type 1 glutamine amidotransferase-like domain-containing protein [[Clostridium] dakarense]|uniref:Type 1 glutamine amidotransferase-like domain-containing protein n=1 Tax=Faecalimicrobium dakarense TaxID=1301100 RepID=UPI0004B829ED|nr:Type 1 glutamine amidotransferase-like domain-containing protein [[Clostridium] dakarense]